MRWPARNAALNEAFVDKRINVLTGRMSKHFKCAKCEGIFPTSKVQVDHIDPAVPLEGFTNWDSVINRMFCEKDGFQILCLECHASKTKEERIIRKQYGK